MWCCINSLIVHTHIYTHSSTCFKTINGGLWASKFCVHYVEAETPKHLLLSFIFQACCPIPWTSKKLPLLPLLSLLWMDRLQIRVTSHLDVFKLTSKDGTQISVMHLLFCQAFSLASSSQMWTAIVKLF